MNTAIWFNIAIETARAAAVAAIVAVLMRLGSRKGLSGDRSWRLILGGFGLLLFGSLLDISDNFPALGRFIVIGDTETEAFLEKVVGYLGGFTVLAIGIGRWLPLVLRGYESDTHRAAEARTADFAATASDWYWEMGPDLRFTWLSERYEEVLGTSGAATVGKTSFELLAPEEAAETAKWAAHRADLEARRPFKDLVYRWRPVEGGSLIWVRVTGRPHYAPDGTFLGYRGAGTDVTAEIEARQARERAVREQEERWLLALEGAGHGVWDWRADTNKVFFSALWKSMLGYAENEVGDDLEEWSSRVHPDDLPGCLADLERHFEGKTPFYRNEHRVRCKDGGYKWILDQGRVWEWRDGKPLRVVGTHTDITERKRLEERLAAENAMRTDILDTMAHGVAIYDKDLRLVDRNERYAVFLELPRESVRRGAPLADIVRTLAARGVYGTTDPDGFTRERIERYRRRTIAPTELFHLENRILVARHRWTDGSRLVVTLTEAEGQAPDVAERSGPLWTRAKILTADRALALRLSLAGIVLDARGDVSLVAVSGGGEDLVGRPLATLFAETEHIRLDLAVARASGGEITILEDLVSADGAWCVDALLAPIGKGEVAVRVVTATAGTGTEAG